MPPDEEYKGFAQGQRSDVGQRQCQEKFFVVGRMVGRRMAEKKRRKNFVLGLPTVLRQRGALFLQAKCRGYS